MKKTTTMITWMMSIVLLSQSTKAQTDPIIMQEQGIVLNNAGLICLPAEYMQLSLMYKIEKPTLLQTPACIKQCYTDIDFKTCERINTKPQTQPYEEIPNTNKNACIEKCTNDKDCAWMMWREETCKLYQKGKTFTSTNVITWDADCLRMQRHCKNNI